MDELKLRICNQIVQIEKNRNAENYCEEINAVISDHLSKLREAKNTTVYALAELAESRDNEKAYNTRGKNLKKSL